MFFLSLIEHTLQLRPHLLDLPLNEAVKGEFESLFLDKSKIARDSDPLKLEEEDLTLKVGECLEEQVKERSVHSKETPQFMSGAQSLEVLQKLEVQFPLVMNDDEDLTQLSGSKSTSRDRKRS